MNLETVSSYRVLCVGDAIQDVYRHCHALGRGTKEPILSVKLEKEETFQGGVWAAAAHLKDLVARVDVWHGELVAVNTKYVADYNQKLFSSHKTKKVWTGFVPEPLETYDLIVVFDYNLTGFLNHDLRAEIMSKAKYLAVMSQSNSVNFGMNRVSHRFPEANLCIVDEIEARLATHEPDLPIEDVMKKLPYPKVIVTLGKHGAIGYDQTDFYEEGAQTDRPLDLLGAGDAFLAVCAPFAAAGASIADLVHVGNVAAGLKVAISGQGKVSKQSLMAHL